MSSGFASLPDYEQQFAYRFTAEDSEYQKYVKRGADRPPVVDDWMGLGSTNNESSEEAPNYEVQFAYRFTEADETYQNYLKRASDPPPIVEDWRGLGGGHARGRDYRYQEYRPYRGQGRGRGWSGDQWGSQQWHDRRWTQGGGQYSPSSGHHNAYSRVYRACDQRPRDTHY